MIKVEARPNEPEPQLFRRFKGKVARSGVLAEVRVKRWHVSRSEKRRLERKKAARRQHRKQTDSDDR